MHSFATTTLVVVLRGGIGTQMHRMARQMVLIVKTNKRY